MALGDAFIRVHANVEDFDRELREKVKPLLDAIEKAQRRSVAKNQATQTAADKAITQSARRSAQARIAQEAGVRRAVQEATRAEERAAAVRAASSQALFDAESKALRFQAIADNHQRSAERARAKAADDTAASRLAAEKAELKAEKAQGRAYAADLQRQAIKRVNNEADARAAEARARADRIATAAAKAQAAVQEKLSNLTVEIDVDERQLERDAEAAVETAEDGLSEIDVGMDVDARGLARKARSARDAAQRALNDITVQIDANISGLLGKVATARAEIARLAPTFRVVRDLIEIDLERLGRRFDSFGEGVRDNVDIAIANLEALDRAARRVSVPGTTVGDNRTDLPNLTEAQIVLGNASKVTTAALGLETTALGAAAAAAIALAAAKNAASSANFALAAAATGTSAALLGEAAAARELEDALDRLSRIRLDDLEVPSVSRDDLTSETTTRVAPITVVDDADIERIRQATEAQGDLLDVTIGSSLAQEVFKQKVRDAAEVVHDATGEFTQLDLALAASSEGTRISREAFVEFSAELARHEQRLREVVAAQDAFRNSLGAGPSAGSQGNALFDLKRTVEALAVATNGTAQFNAGFASLIPILRRLRAEAQVTLAAIGKLPSRVAAPFTRIRDAARDASREVTEANQGLQRFAAGRGLVKTIANMKAFSAAIEAADTELKRFGRTRTKTDKATVESIAAVAAAGQAVVDSNEAQLGSYQKLAKFIRDRAKADVFSSDDLVSKNTAKLRAFYRDRAKADAVRLNAERAIAQLTRRAALNKAGEPTAAQRAAAARAAKFFIANPGAAAKINRANEDAAKRARRAAEDTARDELRNQEDLIQGQRKLDEARKVSAFTAIKAQRAIDNAHIKSNNLLELEAIKIRRATEDRIRLESRAAFDQIFNLKGVAKAAVKALRTADDARRKSDRAAELSALKALRAAEDLERKNAHAAEDEIERIRKISAAADTAERAAAIRSRRAAENRQITLNRATEDATLKIRRRDEDAVNRVDAAVKKATKTLGFFNLSLVKAGRFLRLLPLVAVLGIAAAFAAAAVAATALATALAGFGVKFAEDVAQIRAQVAGLGEDLAGVGNKLSSKQIDAFTKDIQDLAKEFGAPLGATALLVERFVAMGLNGSTALKLVRAELKGLSGTFQLTEDNVEAVGKALLAIGKEGAVSIGSLDALEAVFPQASTQKIIRQIAEDLGKSTKQVRKLIDEGKIGSGTALRAASEVFADLRKNTNGARKDAVSLRDEFNKLVGRIRDTLGPAFDGLRKKLIGIFQDFDVSVFAEHAQDIADTFGDIADTIAKNLPDIISGLLTTFQAIEPILKAIIGGTIDFIRLLESEKFRDFASDIRDAFVGIKDLLAGLGGPSFKLFIAGMLTLADILGKIGRAISTVRPLLDIIGKLNSLNVLGVVLLLTALNDALEKLGDLLGPLVGKIGSFGDEIGTALAAKLDVAVDGVILFLSAVGKLNDGLLGSVPGLRNLGAAADDAVAGLRNASDANYGLGASADDAKGRVDGLEDTLNGLNGAKRTTFLDVIITQRFALDEDDRVFGSANEGIGGVPLISAAQQKKINQDVKKAAKDNLNSLNNLAKDSGGGSGGKSPAELAADRFKSFLESFKDSIRDLKDTLKTGDVDAIRKRLRDLRRDIIDAFADAGKGRPDGLLDRLARQQKRLVKLVKEREAIVKRLELAKEATDAAISDVSSFADITSAFEELTAAVDGTAGSLADLSRLKIIKPGQDTLNIGATLGTAATAAQVNGEKLDAILKARLKAIQDFQADLNTIIQRGVNRNLIQQIVDAGVSGGAATADALANASNATIASINATQAQIDAAAKALGSTAGDVAASVGENVVVGIVEGLKKQKSELVDAITDLVNVIIKRLKKGLGIKSPSTVTGWVGKMTGKGLINSMLASIPHIERAAGRMTDAATPAINRISLPELAARGGKEARAQLDVALADGRSEMSLERRHRELVGAVRDGHVKEGARVFKPTPPPQLSTQPSTRPGGATPGLHRGLR